MIRISYVNFTTTDRITKSNENSIFIYRQIIYFASGGGFTYVFRKRIRSVALHCCVGKCIRLSHPLFVHYSTELFKGHQKRKRAQRSANVRIVSGRVTQTTRDNRIGQTKRVFVFGNQTRRHSRRALRSFTQLGRVGRRRNVKNV